MGGTKHRTSDELSETSALAFAKVGIGHFFITILKELFLTKLLDKDLVKQCYSADTESVT